MSKVTKIIVSLKNQVIQFVSSDRLLSDLPSIERSAVDKYVTLGSQYDIRTDTIVKSENMQIKSDIIHFKTKPICRLIRGAELKDESVLRILGVDDNIRLSIALKIIEPKGICSVTEYPFPIRDKTRLIYYFHQSRTDSFVEKLSENLTYFNQLIPDPLSTHIITKVSYGIVVVILFQLNTDDQSSISKIDNILLKLTSHLENHPDVGSSIARNDEEILRFIDSITIYSNIDGFPNSQNIFSICQNIQNIEQNLEIHRPLSFNLQTLAQFYSSNTSNTSFTIDRKYVNDIESYLSSLSVRRNTLEKILSDLSENLQDNLTEQFNYINKRSSQLNNYYLTEVKILKDEVIAIRNGQHSLDNLQKLLNKVDKESLKIELNDLLTDAVSLKEKNKLIVYLQQNQITYLNVKYIDIAQDDPFPVVEQKLLRNEPNSQIFCTNDHLQKNEKRRWDEIFPQFIEQRKKLPNLHLIYADFTYSTYELQGSKIIYSKQSLKTSPEPPSLKDDSTIKLLLYGESGVGKSTFINAFANYLQFESIEQARLGKALVLIPVSFLITINDQFEERLIEFGHDDANENHNDQGQSVTQHCKSYEFHLLNGQKLEIIDTPGFGDTRGQNQDDENLRGIFSYLDNVSHLNALCILLKPNVNKLNPTFRSSLMQILDFFGNDFHPNIFFCFTNCQSTFFSIGDTGPILRKFLQRYPEKKINLKKENTFCFDSESFRYLVASGRSIQFDQQFIEQFQSSWKRSVEESNRFIDKICSKERQLHIDGTWISMEEIKREINDLHRPMLETIRNLIRNMILSAEGFCIQLKPSVILSSMYLCYKLNRICQDFKGINIMLDNIHPSSDQCESEHLMTNYRLNYELNVKPNDQSTEDLKADIYAISKTSAQFDYVLNNDHRAFLFGIDRMVQEEESICEQYQKNALNQKVLRQLKQLKDIYDENWNEVCSIDKNELLKNINSRIEEMKNIAMICQQLHLLM